MVFLGLTEETGGNANSVGLAHTVIERLAGKMDRPVIYVNALTRPGNRESADGHALG